MTTTTATAAKAAVGATTVTVVASVANIAVNNYIAGPNARRFLASLAMVTAIAGNVLTFLDVPLLAPGASASGDCVAAGSAQAASTC